WTTRASPPPPCRTLWSCSRTDRRGGGAAMYAYVGCYTDPDRKGRGAGLGIFRMDPASGAWTAVDVVRGLANPSFLALGPQQRHLYCVHGGRSEVSAFDRDPATGGLSLLNTVPCGGTNPVHLAVHPDGRCLLVANYAAGTAAALPIGADGA